MPKQIKALSSAEVNRLAHSGGKSIETHPVGGVSGLYLAITPTGTRSWVLRAVVGRRRRKIGLGSFPSVTLAQAREAAREARARIAEGVDPVEERKAAQAALREAQDRLTFAEALVTYHAKKVHEFRSEKHKRQWLTETERLVGNALGPMPVADIKTEDVRRALDPHWLERTDTARRVRGRIERVLDWAKAAKLIPSDALNAAAWKGNLQPLLAAPRKVAKPGHWPAVALDDLPRWWSDLAGREGTGADALRFLTLTAARSGEVRSMTWEEVALDKGIWILPADRMKADRPHRVPLSPEALDLLGGLRRIEGSHLVFPAARGGTLSDATLSGVMKRMHEAEEKAGRPGYLDPESKRPAVPHGLRSSFRDWVAERTNYPGDMAELALAHKIANSVEASYRRGDQFEKRRRMMADWAAALLGEYRGQVVPIRGAGA